VNGGVSHLPSGVKTGNIMEYQNYHEQRIQWPQDGKHILANYDEESISVYQAYCPEIADFAVKHQLFGGAFRFSRMSWIKPNFLWMMYRSGWARKEGQERILSIRIPRTFFDELLEHAVQSHFDDTRFSTREEWRSHINNSEVRLQWDPDHDPHGGALERRAIQLGLRGTALTRYGRTEVLGITDMTAFVIRQRTNLSEACQQLCVPVERVYLPKSERARTNVGID
jgi:hypothetical protein